MFSPSLNSLRNPSNETRFIEHGADVQITMISKEKAAVFAGAAILRLALFAGFPSLPDLLTGRVEISTPVTSFKRCKQLLSLILALELKLIVRDIVQEGLFLYNHNVWPYDGGVYHQAPLLLPLFSLLPDVKQWPIFTALLYIMVDILSAEALTQIATSGEAAKSRNFTSPRAGAKTSGVGIAAA